jgi:lipoprotein-anchoring transpeptidase ErfK/SrfK
LLRRALPTLLVAVLASHAGGASAGTKVPRHPVSPTQTLVLLLTVHAAVAAPGSSLSTGELISASRPITGEKTTLPVIGHATSAAGLRLLRVMLPGRPNGRTGWIEARGTILTTSRWHIVVRTGTRRVLVYRSGKLTRSFRAIVGKPSTPTPHGQFFVEESVRMPPRAAGAPFALALSARSNALQEFEGGPGQIAIHGMHGLAGVPGTAVSHGCVRLNDHDMRWLAAQITTGVLVSIIS